MFRVLQSAAIALLAVGAPAAIAGGVWTDPGTSTYLGTAEGDYALDPLNTCGRPPLCNSAVTRNTYLPGFAGRDYGQIAYADCSALVATCPVIGRGFARATADGLGTDTFEARWKLVAQAFHECDCAGYRARGAATISAAFEATVQTVPPGQTVTVYFAWWALINNAFDPEVPPLPDDPTQTTNVALSLAGTDLIAPGTADFVNVAALVYLPGPGAGIGSFVAQDGDTIRITIDGRVEAAITDPPKVPFNNQDQAEAAFNGGILLSIDVPLPPLPSPAVGGVALFSQDIGSDTEMSDPTPDGNEVFDPGDVYTWGGPALPVGGADGFRDDPEIFWTDYWPVAPDGPPPATGAWTCAGLAAADIAQLLADRFDLDGTDVLDVSLRDVIPDGALGDPLPSPAAANIHEAEHLLVSFDDDWSGHYAGALCEVPVARPSPAGLTHGRTAVRDEVVGIEVGFAWPPVPGAAPGAIAAVFPVAAEDGVHPNLAPNPDPGEDADDDVDALDVLVAAGEVWYFSADHEATGIDPFNGVALDPGAIYEVLGPPSYGPVKVIDPVVHLGLPAGVDLDAFEFVRLETCIDPADPATCYTALAVAFSVDDDDYLTPGVDESGGADPRQVYASFLTGTFFPLLDAPLTDDVDALTASPRPFVPNPCNVSGAFADCNGNGAADLCDVVSGASPDCNANLVPDECDIASGTSVDANGNGIPDECEPSPPICRGDCNCDGVVGFADIDYFVAAIPNNAAAWAALYAAQHGGAAPPCPFANCDVNASGNVGFDDIDPFVARIPSVCP